MSYVEVILLIYISSTHVVLAYPSLPLPFHWAYVSASIYLHTHGLHNMAGIPTPLRNPCGPRADLEGAKMPVELNCPASLSPLAFTAEGIPGRRLAVLRVLVTVGVASCVTIPGPSPALSPVSLVSGGVVGLV